MSKEAATDATEATRFSYLLPFRVRARDASNQKATVSSVASVARGGVAR
jgi:hypothetical protein